MFGSQLTWKYEKVKPVISSNLSFMDESKMAPLPRPGLGSFMIGQSRLTSCELRYFRTVTLSVKELKEHMESTLRMVLSI